MSHRSWISSETPKTFDKEGFEALHWVLWWDNNWQISDEQIQPANKENDDE